MARRMGGQGVFRGHHAEGHTHDRIGAGGVDPQFAILPLQRIREGKAHAMALADPIGLHGTNLFGPAIERVEFCQKFLGIGGNAHEPLGDFLPDHGGVATPAAALDDLLVGQDRMVVGAPIDGRGLLVNQVLFQELQEEPLLPAIIFRRAGRQLALPVIAKAQLLELTLHVSDVFVGPVRRMNALAHGGVFGRKPKSIPAHGLKHVFSQHPLVTRHDIPDGVVSDMAHVQSATRIGEHRQAIVFLPRGVLDRPEDAFVLPKLLGFGFDNGGLVVLFHGEGCRR